MQKWISTFVTIGLLFLSYEVSARNVCVDFFGKLPKTRFYEKDHKHRGPPERRIKILTSGLRQDADSTMDAADFKIDTADPSLIMPITYPDGRTKYRIGFSGLRYIEADRPDDFFRGGVFKVRRSRGFYKDGTEMLGPYHNSSWPWDVVVYTNKLGEQIAFGGVMEQPMPGALPGMDRNWTRSRWWGKVTHVEVSPHVFEEHIIWQEPLHDFNRQERSGWLLHGYGGTLLTKFNSKTGLHEPLPLKNGNYLLFYERVVSERTGLDGNLKPWVTTMFAREVEPSLKSTMGVEVLVTDVINPLTGDYFKATQRWDHGVPSGHLAEGGNVLIEKNKNQLIKAWSANDYVGRYGVFLDYLPPGADPRTLFKAVVNEQGELIDFADTMNLREILNATWLGRPQLEYDVDGRLWLKFHFVPRKSIPEGAPIEGWPTAEQYLHYGRISAIAPVRFQYDKQGQPLLVLDIGSN